MKRVAKTMLPGILVAALCHLLTGGKADDGESVFGAVKD